MTLYEPRSIKRRRANKSEMQSRYGALYTIVAEMRPMTVRQVYYQATVRGVIEKTEQGYAKLKAALADMRRAGELPYTWLADNMTWKRKPSTFDGPQDAILQAARYYRKSLWTGVDAYVEIWLEKDALAGVIYDITSEYDVPLMVARGYASLSFLHALRAEMRRGGGDARAAGGAHALQDAGEVDEAHRTHARQRLAERQAKRRGSGRP
jgi:hypothetical protein